MINKEEIAQKVNITLEELRPFLHADGGDMEIAEITDDAIVKVRLIGACSSCSMSMMTIKAGLEEALKKIAPEIKAVEAINQQEFA